MADCTRVSQLGEALAKLQEECKAESQKLSQLFDTVNKQQEVDAKNQADNKAFQNRTEEQLHAILDAMAVKVPKKAIVAGEISGAKNSLVHPVVEVEETVPAPNNLLIPPGPDGGGINPRAVNLDFPKFDGTDLNN
jgi:ribosomal protein L9